MRSVRKPSRVECLRVLGLQPGASWRQVQRAYRRLALRYHPDRQAANVPAAEETDTARRFAEITAVYAVLERMFSAERARERLGHCLRCGDLEVLTAGLDGNGYCRTCLLTAEGKRALPAPPAVVVSCAAFAVGLALAATALAAWLRDGWIGYWWLSITLSAGSILGLAVTCVIVGQSASPEEIAAHRRGRSSEFRVRASK